MTHQTNLPGLINKILTDDIRVKDLEAELSLDLESAIQGLDSDASQKRAQFIAEEFYLAAHDREDVDALEKLIVGAMRHFKIIGDSLDEDRHRRECFDQLIKDIRGSSSGNQQLFGELESHFENPRQGMSPMPDCGLDGSASEVANLFDPQRKHVCRHHGVVLLPVDATVYVIGDLHGDVHSLNKILDRANVIPQLDNPHDKACLVFLGDYVNNGLKSIETLQRVLWLKSKYPNQVVVLNGNHEFRESYFTVVKEYFQTHWANSLRARYANKQPGNHYGHIRLELATRFGYQRGEELYEQFESWGQRLPYICLVPHSSDGQFAIMISHSIGLADDLQKKSPLTINDIANAKDKDAMHITEYGYEAWKKKGAALTPNWQHAAMVNSRDFYRPGFADTLQKFYDLFDATAFIVGHTHYRSGDVITRSKGGRMFKVATLSSSHKDSSDAGHYMHQEYFVERIINQKRDVEQVDREAQPCYFLIDPSLTLQGFHHGIRPI